jgi:hypothetical protein
MVIVADADRLLISAIDIVVDIEADPVICEKETSRVELAGSVEVT